MVAQFRRDLARWRVTAEWLRGHQRGCSLCRGLKGACRHCIAGRMLQQAAKDAKRAADLSTEDVVHLLGKEKVEALARRLWQPQH